VKRKKIVSRTEFNFKVLCSIQNINPSSIEIMLTKHILFVCSANKDRSRTAEDYFSQHYPDICFDSAGTNAKICRQLGTTYITENQLAVADQVLVMENKHRQALLQTFGTTYAHKISVLHIRDIYPYGAKALIDVLRERVSF